MTQKTAIKSNRQFAQEPQQATAGDDAVSTLAERKRESKIDKVITLLKREQGATLAEMVQATGWQSHTTRAMLTGLKKKGHVVTKDKRDGVTCYRIAKAGQ